MLSYCCLRSTAKALLSHTLCPCKIFVSTFFLSGGTGSRPNTTREVIQQFDIALMVIHVVIHQSWQTPVVIYVNTCGYTKLILASPPTVWLYNIANEYSNDKITMIMQ